MRRLLRLLRRGLIVLLLLAVVVGVALRFYLRSSGAARRTAGVLTQTLGVPAEVDGVVIPFRGEATASGLRLLDGDGQPFLEAGRAAADLSVLGYLRGATLPGRIDLDDVHLRLRFDQAGNLLTRLPRMKAGPGSLPACRIRAARLTLEQEGRAPFTLEGISLDLDPTLPTNLVGALDDPLWGELEVRGKVDKTGAFSITLDSRSVALTPAMLRSLPFVPPPVWTTLQADGPAVPLTFTLSVAMQAPFVRYEVQFGGARVALLQPARGVAGGQPPAIAPPVPALVVSGARGVLKGSEKGFDLEGAIHDPYWGEWEVKAGLESAVGALRVELRSDEASVDPRKLEALPYVPKSVWSQVRAAGKTGARVEVRLFTGRPEVHYRVELDVKEAAVHVSSIDLDAGDAAGSVVIEDSQVWLRRVTGRTAGGTIAASGSLDFRGPKSLLSFDVDVRGLALRQLPRKWELPAQVEGKVTGWARLDVTVGDDAPVTDGLGTGRIDEVKLVGLPSTEPILLDLHADGTRLRFVPQSPLLRLFMAAGPPRPQATHPVALRPASTARPGLVPPVGRLAGRALSVLGKGTDLVLKGASVVLEETYRFDQPPPPDRVPVYLDARVQMDDVDLADLVRRVGLVLPVPVAGRLSFRLTLGVPINTASDLRAYRLTGAVSLPRLEVGGLEMASLQAQVDYADGLLRLGRLSGDVLAAGGGRGSFAGRASARVFPRGDLALDLALRGLPVERVARLVPGLAGKASGTLSGTVRAAVPLERMQEPSAWRGAASLVVPQLEAFGVTVSDASAGLTVVRGTALLSEVKGDLHGAPLAGSASLSLAGAQRFSAELQWRGLDVARLATLLPAAYSGLAAGGAVTATAEAAGTLRPLVVRGSGSLSSGPLRLGTARLDRLSVRWAVDDGMLKVRDLQAALYRGEVTGTAEVPLSPRAPGRADLAIRTVDLRALAASLGKVPFRVEGQVSGRAVAAYDPGKGKTGTWAGEVDLSASTLMVEKVPAQRLRGKVEYRDGRADYSLEGETLGGKVTIEGRLPPPPMRAAGQSDGRLRVERIGLSRVWPVLHLRRKLEGLRGALTVDLPFRHEGSGMALAGRGLFEVRDLRWQGNELAESVRGEVRLGAEGVFVRDVSAELAGGSLRASAGYRINDPSRSWFSINLYGAEASRLLVVEGGKEAVQGPIDVHLRGTLGPEWRGTGSVELSRGKVYGIEVAEWRLPVDFTFAPAYGQGELMIRESSAQVGNGRAQFRASVSWGDSMRLEGTLRFFDASLRCLAGLVGDVSSYAQGRMSGRVDLGGSEVRSLNDLTASVQMTLSEAQALQMPILNQVGPYLLPGQSASSFRSGDLQARLGNGVWRIAWLTLESSLAQVMVQGSVTVQGRLDLEVTGRTSSLGGINPVLLKLLLLSLPAAGPVPVAVIAQASDLLANRLVRVHVTGTTKTPVVVVEPLRLLSEEAVRFFLSRTLLPTK
jgi:hypothetical protein